MSLPHLSDSGIFIISDTILCDGTGALLDLLKSFKRKVAFISEPGHFSHYNTLLKKWGIQNTYWELEGNLEIGDLPMTENPPVTWLDAPRRGGIEKIFEGIKKGREEVVAFADIFLVVMEIGVEKTVELVFRLREMCAAVVVKGNCEVIKQMWMVEEVATVGLYLDSLASGSCSEYLGKVRVECAQGLVKIEVGVFYYKVTKNEVSFVA